MDESELSSSPVVAAHRQLSLSTCPGIIVTIRESHRPSDLNLSLSNDREITEPFKDNNDSSYPPKIPSPTNELRFTPRFLMTSGDSEDDYSDGFSDSSGDDLVLTQKLLTPLVERSEHVKSLVDRFLEEERRKHDAARCV
ncbi:hypothetical protein PtB15_1B531 [Puccinia triticina]|nr:hypothetical protein PtB15_1B531 [Puccinia triticina]